MAAPLIYDYRNLPVYKRDEDFLFKAISYKQGKLDANRAKLQGLYDQYSMMEATKDVDKEYIAQRLNEVKNIADQYAAGDLSSDYLTQNLMGNLDKVVDENVVNAVASTKRYNNEMQEWAHAKANDPDKYRDRNKDYVMSNNPNLQNWLGSEEVGAIYNGGSGFVEYVDYNKRMLEEMPKAMETLGEKWMELEPGSGIYYDKVTKERVPRNKMERVMRLAIGEDGYRQMAIDGWSEAKNYSDEEVLQDYLAVNQHLLDEAIERSEATKITISKTADEVKKKELEETKGYLDRSIERLRKKVESAGEKDKVSMYQELHRDRYEDNILSAYSYGTRITNRDIDQNSLQTIKQQFAERKFSAEMALKTSNAQASKPGTSDGGVFPGGSVVVDEEMGYSKDGVNLQTAIRESGAEALNKLKASSGLTGVDDQDWVTILSSVDINSLAGKEGQEVELADGRKVTLDFSKNPELVANMIKYQNHVNGTDPAVKAYRDNIKELRDTGFRKEDIIDLSAINIAASAIGGKVEINSDGSKKIIKLSKEELAREVEEISGRIFNTSSRVEGGDPSSWDNLNRNKKPLTESEKETLRLWKSAGFLLSSSIDADVLREATITFMDEMVDEGYSLKDAKSLGGVRANPSYARDAMNKIIDENADNIFLGASYIAPAIKSTMGGVYSMMTTDYSAFSDDNLKVFNDRSELALKQSPSTYTPDVRSFLINKKDNPKAFSAMRTSLKLDGAFDGVIEAWTVLNEGGVATGEVRVKYYDKVEGVRGQEAGTPMTMTAEQFDKTGLTLGDITYSEYSITVFGDNAPDLELGSSVVSRDKLRRMQKEGGGGSEGIAVYHEDYWRDMDVLASESELSGEEVEKYNKFKSDFTSGGVNFKLKNDKSTGTYVYTMEDRDGNILAQVDSGDTDIQGSQVSGLITNKSVYIKNDLATTYLMQLLTEQQESKYKY